MARKRSNVNRTVAEEICSQIRKEESYEEAIQKGICAVLENTALEYGVLWYVEKESEILVPLYSISSVDMTEFSCPIGEGIVGKSFLENKPVVTDTWEGDPLVSALSYLNAKSVISVPFSSNGQRLGTIQFIKIDGALTEEEIEIVKAFPSWIEKFFPGQGTQMLMDRKQKIVLSIKDIKKSFKMGEVVTPVLKGVNFNVYEGEFLCLLGASGCGKTTTLNIIGGMETADEGSFYFKGTNLTRSPQKALTRYRRENIGFIFQSYNLMPNLTARQNLELISELVKNPMEAEEALALVGMEEKQNNYPSQLSGGQQQRVSIARALVKKPSLILADEPTAALDYTTSIEVLSAIEDVLQKDGTTLVMVTHNEEITKMADRVIRFRNGQTYEIKVNQHRLKAKELVW